jgi:1-acyl-sn-glycerol-3-phosphate acyltransferase
MGFAERLDDLRFALGRVDRFQAKLGHTLLAAGLADRWRSALAAQKRSRSFRVPGAALVVAGAARPGSEDRVAHGIQRLGGDEDDELPVLLRHLSRLTPDAVEEGLPPSVGRLVNMHSMRKATVRRGPKRPPIAYVLCGVLVAPLFLGVYRLRAFGTEHLPKTGGFVLAPNHLSVIDPWPLAYPTYPRQLRIMAKADLFRPGLRGALRVLGAFPVRRGRADVEALKTAADLVRDGEIVLIFPEGTRLGKTDWTKLREPFHRGAAFVALEAEAPLVPMAIMGTHQLARFGHMRIGCGPPVELDDIRALPRREAAAIGTERLGTALEELLADLQAREKSR